jgi:hypothetical protein
MSLAAISRSLAGYERPGRGSSEKCDDCQDREPRLPVFCRNVPYRISLRRSISPGVSRSSSRRMRDRPGPYSYLVVRRVQ